MGSEEAGDIVDAVLPRRRCNDAVAVAVEGDKGRHIWVKCGYIGWAVEYGEIGLRREQGARRAAKGATDRGVLDGRRRARGKIEDEEIARPRDGEASALRIEGHVLAARLEELRNHIGARQRRVAAEIDLDRGREPAQAVGVAFAPEEGRLRHVVLPCDRLHGRVGKPTGKRADPGRVAAEQMVGESVDLIERQFHVATPSLDLRVAEGSAAPERLLEFGRRIGAADADVLQESIGEGGKMPALPGAAAPFPQAIEQPGQTADNCHATKFQPMPAEAKRFHVAPANVLCLRHSNSIIY